MGATWVPACFILLVCYQLAIAAPSENSTAPANGTNVSDDVNGTETGQQGRAWSLINAPWSILDFSSGKNHEKTVVEDPNLPPAGGWGWGR